MQHRVDTCAAAQRICTSLFEMSAVQLERFACVYTSHVSNLSFYSPDKTFR